MLRIPRSGRLVSYGCSNVLHCMSVQQSWPRNERCRKMSNLLRYTKHLEETDLTSRNVMFDSIYSYCVFHQQIPLKKCVCVCS